MMVIDPNEPWLQNQNRREMVRNGSSVAAFFWDCAQNKRRANARGFFDSFRVLSATGLGVSAGRPMGSKRPWIENPFPANPWAPRICGQPDCSGSAHAETRGSRSSPKAANPSVSFAGMEVCRNSATE